MLRTPRTARTGSSTSTNLVDEITLLKIAPKKTNFRCVSFPATAPLFNPAVKTRNVTWKSGSTSHYTTTPETLVPIDLRTGEVENPYPLGQ